MSDPREVIFSRLEALRLELAARNPDAGFKAEGKFALAIGLHKTSWSQIKKFERDLPLTAAFRIKDNWGLSLDWIYYGQRGDATEIMVKIGRGPAADLDALKRIKPQKQPKRKAG